MLLDVVLPLLDVVGCSVVPLLDVVCIHCILVDAEPQKSGTQPR